MGGQQQDRGATGKGAAVRTDNRANYMIMIYLLIAVGLSPGGSTHLHTNNTQNNTNNN